VIVEAMNYSRPVTDATKHDWAINAAEYGGIPYSLFGGNVIGKRMTRNGNNPPPTTNRAEATPGNKESNMNTTATTTKKAAKATTKKQPAKKAAAKKPAAKKAASKKVTKAAKPTATAPATASRKGTITTLIQREGGATLAEIMEATSWQAHSVRGTISILGKTMKIESGKNADGARTYSAV
jgi:uncharacterized protein DUF3489